MSIRSANNKRVQNREYAGASRKSAASAKPARAAASSVRVVPASAKARRREAEQGESLEGLSKEEKKARKQELRIKEDRMYSAANILMKNDAEYRSKRRIFWVLMAIGVVAIFLVWFLLMGVLSSFPENVTGVLQIVGLVLAYGFVIGAFIFDMVKIRPIRNFYKAQVAGMTDRRVLEILEDADTKDKKDSKKAEDDKPAEEPVQKKRGPKEEPSFPPLIRYCLSHSSQAERSLPSGAFWSGCCFAQRNGVTIMIKAALTVEDAKAGMRSLAPQIERYASLIVRKGVHVKPGQELVIISPVETAEFARTLVRCAYEAGAGHVTVVWSDDAVTRLTYENNELSYFEQMPEWQRIQYETLAEAGACFVFVRGLRPRGA